MPIDNLVSIQGPLIEIFSQLDSNTIQHADEITNARRANEELRNQWLWTADGTIYTIEQDSCKHCGSDCSGPEDAFLYLTRGKDNPIFKNIQEATRQLIHNYNYVPSKEDLEAAINSEDTLKAKLTDLNLQSYSSEWSYFEIDTKKYGQLNPEQRKVAERVYGQGNDFQENMKMLRKEAGINTTRVYVLTPNYIKEHAENDSAIARACRLSNFDGDSYFDANGSYVGDPNYWLRGVPVSAEGATQKIPAELEKIKTALDSGIPFEYNGQFYVPVADGIKIPK